MKHSIDVLLLKLKSKGINNHVICPSVNFEINNLLDNVENAIEIIDERSAGYVATGMCEELREPVVVWCSDNVSYRNLTPALTEAYYKKLPLLVVALYCKDPINQSINPADTIRYYTNNLSITRSETEKDIDTAIKYLDSKIKGPVYLSLYPYTKISNRIEEYKEKSTLLIDITQIIDLIPAESCVHLGRNVRTINARITDIHFRDNHPDGDGLLSMLIGSSVIFKDQLHLGIFTDDELAYDLNMLGNRHIVGNLIVINLNQKKENSAIYNFAKQMQWDCTKIDFSCVNALVKELKIGQTPKYIEVTL